MTQIDAPTDAPTHAVIPPARRAQLRLHLVGRSVVVMLTSLLGLALFPLWVTLVAISPITIVAPLLLPATALVRAYANAHRRGAGRLLGRPLPSNYRRPDRPGPLRRIWTLVSDPASWRDAGWLLVHAAVGFATATLAVTLFLTTIFSLVYPFLYWVTPQAAFGRPFGGWLVFHSVADSTVMLVAAPITFALWFGLQVPLARAELAVTKALLGPR